QFAETALELEEVVAGNILASRDVLIRTVDRDHSAAGKGILPQRVNDVSELVQPFSVEQSPVPDAGAVSPVPREPVITEVLGPWEVGAQPLDVVSPCENPHGLGNLGEHVGLP